MKMQLYNKIMEIKEMSVPVYVGININIQIRNTILVEQTPWDGVAATGIVSESKVDFCMQ